MKVNARNRFQQRFSSLDCHLLTMLPLPFCLGLLTTFLTLAYAATLQPVRDFGDNPTKISMNIYVPDKLPSNAPILVLVNLSFWNDFSLLTSGVSYMVAWARHNHSGACQDINLTLIKRASLLLFLQLGKTTTVGKSILLRA